MNYTIELEQMRERIDRIDSSLIGILAQRQTVAALTLYLKQKNNQPLQSQSREWAVLRRAERLAVANGLDPAFVRSLYYQILAHPFKEFDKGNE